MCINLYFYFDLVHVTNNNLDEQQFNLFDLSCHLIVKSTFVQNIQFPTSDLSPGIYAYAIKCNQKGIYGKLIIF
jgi:hypothetical protein